MSLPAVSSFPSINLSVYGKIERIEEIDTRISDLVAPIMQTLGVQLPDNAHYKIKSLDELDTILGSSDDISEPDELRDFVTERIALMESLFEKHNRKTFLSYCPCWRSRKVVQAKDPNNSNITKSIKVLNDGSDIIIKTELPTSWKLMVGGYAAVAVALVVSEVARRNGLFSS